MLPMVSDTGFYANSESYARRVTGAIQHEIRKQEIESEVMIDGVQAILQASII